jgi:hypothetical protein
MSDQAGPSSPRVPVPPTPAETDEITASLAARRKSKRRNSSIFSSISRGKTHVKQKVKPKERPGRIKDEEEEAEDERLAYEEQAGSEYDAIVKGRSEPIDVKQEDLEETNEAETRGTLKKQEYVWDGG